MLYADLMKKLSGPDYVVLDLRDELLAFYGRISKITALPPGMMSCIMYSILEGIKLDAMASFDVEEAVFSIYEDEFGFEAGWDEPAETVVEALRYLGIEVLNKVRSLDVYESGRLNYRFYCWLDPFSGVLEKYIETDAFAITEGANDVQHL